MFDKKMRYKNAERRENTVTFQNFCTICQQRTDAILLVLYIKVSQSKRCIHYLRLIRILQLFRNFAQADNSVLMLVCCCNALNLIKITTEVSQNKKVIHYLRSIKILQLFRNFTVSGNSVLILFYFAYVLHKIL